MHKHKFSVVKTTWPFADGYGTYCKKCEMILDTGLTYRLAVEIAAQENKKIAERSIIYKIISFLKFWVRKDK